MKIKSHTTDKISGKQEAQVNLSMKDLVTFISEKYPEFKNFQAYHVYFACLEDEVQVSMRDRK